MLSSTRTPYLSRSIAACSSRRSAITNEAAARPERSSPDNNVSPITPAPKIAVMC